MPRGTPNVKRDDTGMRYTTFNVPLAFNPKHASSTYLKSESQSLLSRNAKKGKGVAEEEKTDQRRGSQVIVIHPGSRFIRIGRASEVNPASVPCVAARKAKVDFVPSTRVNLISRPKTRSDGEEAAGDDGASSDPFEKNLGTISASLRDRMRFYKLRILPNAHKVAATFNSQFVPERIPEHNDYEQEWIDNSCQEPVLVGEKALRIADPVAAKYIVKWPIHGSGFNTRDYTSRQAILSDLEALIRITLEERLNIKSSEMPNYSVVLIIPDLYERAYVRDLVNLLLVNLGFKQLCAQQESLAATYGAGISNACVVDIGATKTSVACVDEGLVIADTRMSLCVGGDDLTEFFYVLLSRIHFPYREIDLNNWYDWNVMEDLKARLCTLADADVALNLYDFIVRRPGKLTEKYGLRAYDEIILAPMCLFEPRVVEFERKRAGFTPLSQNVTEEIVPAQTELITNAMVISTKHLMPAGTSSAPEPSQAAQAQTSTAQESQSASETAKVEQPMDVDHPPAGEAESDGAVDIDAFAPTIPPPPPVTYAGGYPIDVAFEASKLPLDVAIFNSVRGAGGGSDERIRKYLSAVLVIGGTSLIPGMAHALESRLQAIATPLVSNMEKVQIIPPPKEVDPRVLCWKGGAVLGKMDSVSELWISASDWDIFGMRALKERCFYL